MSDKMMPFNCTDCKFKNTCLMSFIGKEMDSADLNTTQVQYLRRQTLCKEGEFSSSVKLIIEGFVMLLVEGPNKRNIIIDILKPGDFIGVSAICGEDTYAFSAIAVSDTLVCSIERDEIVGLIKTDGDFAFKLAKWYCSNHSKLYAKLKTIGFKNLHGRMADTLLHLDQFKENEIYKFLNRKDIADQAGMPMESAVRILSEFNESKLINVKGKQIEILDYEKLKMIKKNG